MWRIDGRKRLPSRSIWLFAFSAIWFAAFPVRALAQENGSDFQKQALLFAQHCTKCHTVGQGDRVGPDLKDVTKRRERDWLIGLIADPDPYLDNDPVAKELLKKYNGVRMPNLKLSQVQAEDLLKFIETLSEGTGGGMADVIPLAEQKIATRIEGPDEGTGVPRWGLVALLAIAALSGLSWKFEAVRTAQVLVVLGIGVGYWSFGGQQHHHLMGNNQGYAPEQPVAFSHALHAGEMGMSCLYCHHGAEKGPVAGIPSVNICMNCHKVVRKRKGAREPSAEIAKILAAWRTRPRDGQDFSGGIVRTSQDDASQDASQDALDPGASGNIEWVRVHRLADYVHFNHQVHVHNGIACQECHGPVETMQRMRQASSLSMGWCVDCHRHQGRAAPTHWKRSGGELDCSACHL